MGNQRKERMSSEGGLLAPLSNAMSLAQRDLGNTMKYMCDGFQHHVREAQDHYGRTIQSLGRNITRGQMQQRGAMGQFASLTLSRRAANPIFEMAFHPVDIKHRLTGVPVFTVANVDNSEFVLVSGTSDVDPEPRQLGLFFFKESDAAAMVAKIKEQNPDLAKRSHVMRLTLDKVYDFAINPTEDSLPPGNVIFRFMPDAEQVKHALQLYKEANVKEPAFTGVPVFQAEGLTVKTDKSRYTPLFFSKDDLDAAVGNAYEQREQHRENTNKAHSARASADLEAAQSKFDSADEQGKEQAREGLEKARARSDKYKGRVEGSSKKEAPKVEVGCLEEVLQKMLQADGKGDWGSVMFVPPGAISSQSKK